MRVEILEKLPILHTGCLHVHMQISCDDIPVRKLRVVATRWPELIPIFRIFPLEYLSAFSRLDNK